MIGPIDYRTSVETLYEEKAADVYAEYERRMKIAGAMDFDDLLFKTVEIFNRFPEILERYQSRFRHIWSMSTRIQIQYRTTSLYS